jgi:hypothetical protein
VVDKYGYSVLVTPPPAQRTGPGFDLTIVNTTPNPPPGSAAESPPLTIRIRPVTSRTLPSSVFFDCGGDYDALDGRWHRNCKESGSRVAPEVTLQGWMEAPGPNCLGNLCIEDFHYDFVPDVDFIDEYYGPLGVVASIVGSTAALEALAVVGNPPSNGPGMPLADQRPDGSSRGITLNSFVLPGNQHQADAFARVSLNAELNAWHVDPQGGVFSRHWVGRGAAPAGWTTPVIDAGDTNAAAWANTSWPFDPFDPDARLSKVQPGECARITGSLWQDGAHDGNAPATMSGSPWSFFDSRKGAWLEIHPVDWLERRAIPPAIQKTPALFELIDYDQNTKSRTMPITPEAARPVGAVLRCRELIDGRLTDMNTVTRHDVLMTDDRVDVTVEVKRTVKRGPRRGYVAPGALITPGRFKAVYVVWWESGGAPETDCRSE